MIETGGQQPAPRNQKGNRTGFTTGACAAAAAKAAVRTLIHGKPVEKVISMLPNRQKVTFVLYRCQLKGTQAVASVIKDAGDDPDCTHGAEIVTTVTLRNQPGVELINGDGVGYITKPGLGLDVGEPSITSVPRKNIEDMVAEALDDGDGTYRGALVTINVPGGREMAEKTTNARLGIVGGISILGTTGIVRPYSTASFKASVVQEIDVAHAQGIEEVVLTTGGKSEQFAIDHFQHFPEEAFIQVGDFIGVGLQSAARHKMKQVYIVGMMGKLSKMADGKMQTHVAGSKMNMGLLARLAKEAGGSDALCASIKKGTTARYALELAQKENVLGITRLVCRDVCQTARDHVKGTVGVAAYLFDFNGNLLAEYA